MNFEHFTLNDMQYIVRFPESYTAGKRYPVLIFLHGAGTRGNDISKLEGNAFFRLTEEHEGFPFVSVAPLCSKNTWFDHFEDLKALVRTIISSEYADPACLYLMGNSMGGYGTWQLAMSIPQYFAAIVPICGGGMYWNAGRLANVPVWAFHGALDRTVLPEESEKMVNAVNKKNGNARLTIYPENKHDSWSDTFRNPEVFAWLLKHVNTNEKVLSDAYTGSAKFG